MNGMLQATFVAISVTGLMVAKPSLAQDDSPVTSELAHLVTSTREAAYANFAEFLSVLEAQGRFETRKALEAGSDIDPVSLNLLARLLGVYNRANQESEALALLAELVAIETYSNPEYPNQYDNPAFIHFGEKIEAVAESFGMLFRNIDGRIFEVTLDGPSEEVFGILTHADVVPVQSDTWTLEDGTTMNPFEMQIIGNRIYGRGTIDDKGSIATALYAMKAVKESGLPLKRDIRLMIETTEETSGAGMEYYLEHESAPDYNIVLDSDYPAVTAEKGYGTIRASFPVVDVDGEDSPTIISLSGSAAANQIPDNASAIIETKDAVALAETLNKAAVEFITTHGGDFTMEAIVTDQQQVRLLVNGVSAHASEPENGINPVPRLASFLSASEIDFADNHYWQAVSYFDEAYGLDWLGTQLDVAYADDFMGPLTLSPTYFEATDSELLTAVNVRAPRHSETDAAGVQAQIAEALERWRSHALSQAAFEVNVTDWMVRNTDGTWLKTLLEIYGDTTGEPAEPISSPGSTTAKLLPNAVNFGPNMPTDKYMGHTENEFKRLDVMGLDMQMFTEMMVRLSNLPSLE